MKQELASEKADNQTPDRAPKSQREALLDKIDRLKKDNKKKENEIKLFRDKELREEAEALLTEKQLDAGAGSDPIHRMTKLLRKFHDLMMVTTLEEDGQSEDCVICLEKMRLKKCYGLPCEHMICDTCLPKMCKGADETVRCPTCREVCPREVIELITYTEQDRWDALLKVAEAWGAGDRRREAATSEEEAEENFVDDETKSYTSSLRANSADEDSESSDSGPFKPQTVERQPYLQSPVKEKRKRMEELAARKKRK